MGSEEEKLIPGLAYRHLRPMKAKILFLLWEDNEIKPGFEF